VRRRTSSSPVWRCGEGGGRQLSLQSALSTGTSRRSTGRSCSPRRYSDWLEFGGACARSRPDDDLPFARKWSWQPDSSVVHVAAIRRCFLCPSADRDRARLEKILGHPPLPLGMLLVRDLQCWIVSGTKPQSACRSCCGGAGSSPGRRFFCAKGLRCVSHTCVRCCCDGRTSPSHGSGHDPDPARHVCRRNHARGVTVHPSRDR
jgi:hypothetical protein